MSSPNNKPILYIEDSEDDVYLMKYAFERAGVANPIQVAHDGREGMEHLERAVNDGPSHSICLVLLDLKLPRKTGLEVLQWMRSQPRLKKVPAIIFSSSNQKADLDRAYEYGANAFLVKPSDPKSLQEIVKAINSFWLVHNQFPD